MSLSLTRKLATVRILRYRIERSQQSQF